MQYDYGTGPVIGGVATVLFVAWLPWSKARFVMPLVDKTMPSVSDALDQAFRFFGEVPAYVLTDNERTVTSDYVCRMPVRNTQIVSLARWYSTTLHTCMPYDPASKGGVERSVQVAKADLVPRDTNLRGEYQCFADLVAACREFNDKVNHQVNSSGFVPMQRLVKERESLHRVPREAYPLCDGISRQVGKKMPVVVFDRTQYSVPHELMGETVYVRYNRVQDRVVITYRDKDGMVTTVANHKHGEPGQVVLEDAHFPARQPSGPLVRRPVATSEVEKSFLEIGEGALRFVRVAADSGVNHLSERLARIVDIIPVYGRERLNTALGLCADTSRFTIEDVISIMQRASTGKTFTVMEDGDSLAQGTSG